MMVHKSSVDGLYFNSIDRCVVAATLAENIGDRLRYMSVDAVGSCRVEPLLSLPTKINIPSSDNGLACIS